VDLPPVGPFGVGVDERAHSRSVGNIQARSRFSLYEPFAAELGDSELQGAAADAVLPLEAGTGGDAVAGQSFAGGDELTEGCGEPPMRRIRRGQPGSPRTMITECVRLGSRPETSTCKSRHQRLIPGIPGYRTEIRIGPHWGSHSDWPSQ
jgi:hypothetical protein